VFGGFALRANLLGRLEQIDSFAPGHQIRFGNMNYMADIRGDLIFDGFEPTPGTPDSHDKHGLDLLSDNAQDIIPDAASDLHPGQVALPMDGGLDPAPQAAHSSAVESNVGLTSVEAWNPGPSDSYPAVGPGPLALEPAEPGWAPVMEFTAADIFQHSPFGNMLNLVRSLSLSGGSRSNYVRPEWEAGDEGIRCPPTTHFIATIEDLTDVHDFDSEDIDGMDDDAGEAPESLGRGTTSLSHDIYMVHTPNKDDNDNPEDETPRQKPKRRRRRRSKSSNCKNSDKSARRVDITANSESNNDHMDPAMEQDEPGHTKSSSEQIPDHNDPEG